MNIMEPLKFKIEKSEYKQFFNNLLDNLNDLNTSIFNTANTNRYQNNYIESIKWYKLYTILKNTDPDQLYICYIELGIVHKILEFDFNKIEQFFLSAKDLVPDRAEAYYHLGLLYNQNKMYLKAYETLKHAITLPINNDYKFVNEKAYGKYLYDELSVACYWLEKYTEGLQFLNEIINDPDFEYCSQRLLENEKFFKEKKAM